MDPKRTPELPAREALYREIPDTMLEETITGAATVDEIDLASVDGTSVLGKWVFVTPKGGDCYMRRFGATAPNSTSMQKGHLWLDGVAEEFYVHPNAANTNLAVEGNAAMTLVFELGSGT